LPTPAGKRFDHREISTQFGTDGGYIKTLVVDGATYTYDGNNTVTPSVAHAFSFNTSTDVLTVTTLRAARSVDLKASSGRRR
jgi:hypothetical protein